MTLSETLVEETGTQAPLMSPRTGPAPPPQPLLGEYRTSKSAAMVPGVNSIRAVAIAERALMKSMADLPLVEIQGRKVLIEAVSEKISTGWL
jgi:hypothetical protein